MRSFKAILSATFSAAIILTSGVFSPAGAIPIHAGPTLSEMLNSLQVSTEQSSSTYERSQFQHWIDADRDKCDTRIEVLQEESTTRVTCSLKGGIWISAYDGLKVTNPSLLDVDHVVPLKEAWESGASGWSADSRKRYANDLDYSISLIAVTAKTNRSKSDRDPAEWLPPLPSFVCQYVGRWVAVKYRWSLTIDTAEKNVLLSKIGACGAKALVATPSKASIGIAATNSPSPSPSKTQSSWASPTATPSPATSKSSTPSPSSTVRPLDPKFASCAEAKRNGYKRSYVKGIDPEYYFYKDGDGDGIVCE